MKKDKNSPAEPDVKPFHLSVNVEVDIANIIAVFMLPPVIAAIVFAVVAAAT